MFGSPTRPECGGEGEEAEAEESQGCGSVARQRRHDLLRPAPSPMGSDDVHSFVSELVREVVGRWGPHTSGWEGGRGEGGIARHGPRVLSLLLLPFWLSLLFFFLSFFLTFFLTFF